MLERNSPYGGGRLDSESGLSGYENGTEYVRENYLKEKLMGMMGHNEQSRFTFMANENVQGGSGEGSKSEDSEVAVGGSARKKMMHQDELKKLDGALAQAERDIQQVEQLRSASQKKKKPYFRSLSGRKIQTPVTNASNFVDFPKFELDKASKTQNESQAPTQQGSAQKIAKKKLTVRPPSAGGKAKRSSNPETQSRNGSVSHSNRGVQAKIQPKYDASGQFKSDSDIPFIIGGNKYPSKDIVGSKLPAEHEGEENLDIDPVTELTQSKLMKWLVEIHLIKEIPD